MEHVASQPFYNVHHIFVFFRLHGSGIDVNVTIIGGRFTVNVINLNS
jgi:hypothetical protein